MAETKYKETMQKKGTDEVVQKYLKWLQEQGSGHSIEMANKYKKSQDLGPMGISIFDQKIKKWQMDNL